MANIVNYDWRRTIVIDTDDPEEPAEYDILSFDLGHPDGDILICCPNNKRVDPEIVITNVENKCLLKCQETRIDVKHIIVIPMI